MHRSGREVSSSQSSYSVWTLPSRKWHDPFPGAPSALVENLRIERISKSDSEFKKRLLCFSTPVTEKDLRHTLS